MRILIVISKRIFIEFGVPYGSINMYVFLLCYIPSDIN